MGKGNYYIEDLFSEGVREYIRTHIKHIIEYIKYIGPDLLVPAGPDLLFLAGPDLLFPAGPDLLFRLVRGQSYINITKPCAWFRNP